MSQFTETIVSSETGPIMPSDSAGSSESQSEAITEASDNQTSETTVEASNEDSTASEEGVVENTESEVQEPAPEDLFTQRFSALSRKEKKLLEEQAKIKEVQSQLDTINSIREAKDPVKALEFYGLSVDDLVNAVLGEESEPEQQLDPVEALKKEFEEYKQSVEQEREAKKQKALESQEQEIQQVINSHKQTIDSFIKDNADQYELIHSQNQSELVWEVTEAYFENHGKVLSVEEASNMVEKHLEDEARKLLALKKFSPKVEQNEVPVKDNKVAPRKFVTTTLTNNHSSSPIQTTIKKPMSREESLREAAKQLKWK